MGPNWRQEVIPREDILVPVLPQTRKLRGNRDAFAVLAHG